MSVYKQPNILFLKGIVENDIKTDDDMFDKKFVEHIEDIKLPLVLPHSFSEIPTKFTSWETWPKTSNLKCWSCNRNFKTTPIFIVDDFCHDISGIRVITPKGNFCSDNCAQHYINLNYHRGDRDDKTKYQLMMHKERTGENVLIIQPSPDKVIMKDYCGNEGISEEEFGKLIDKLNTEFRLCIRY